MAKVSIIVPVYNAQAHLGKCMESLVSQTLKDIEIICINDKSTDDSLAILEYFARQDERVKIINTNNRGVLAVRNIGMGKACGEYLMFVNGEDWIEHNTCEECYNQITANQADVLIFNSGKYNTSTKKISVSEDLINISEQTFYFTDAPVDFFYILTSVFGKMYKNVNLPTFKTRLSGGAAMVFFWEYCLKNNPKVTISGKTFYYSVVTSGGKKPKVKTLKRCQMIKSVNSTFSSEEFKVTDEVFQAYIADRYAKAILVEIDKSNIKLHRKYFKDTHNFLSTVKKYFKIYEMPFCKKLKIELLKKKHPFLSKHITYKQQQRHHVIKIFGLTLKIKRRCSRQHIMQYYINLVRKNYKKYKQDTYLLFDNLIDADAEAIDAYSLFEVMQEQKLPVYYVLRKQTALYKRLDAENRLDNIIALSFSPRTHPNEFMQKIYDVLLKTKCVVTSFGNNFGSIDMFFRRHPSWKYVFIQHGTIFMKESVLYNGYLYPEKFDKFLVCSKRERGLFLKYHFPARKLIMVGLPRWDLLKDLPKPEEKSILLMLTWRHLNPLTFNESLYKKNLFKLLHNEKLSQYLKLNDIKLYFAAHHALLSLMDIEFDLSAEDNIQMIEGNSVSRYIRKCSCLITDFSSVAFDFMFQYKPVVFYMLDKGDTILDKDDKEDLRKFDYKKYILPDVFFDEDAVVERIIEYCENNFEVDETRRSVYDSFFYTKENIRLQLIEELEKILV